jgi:hypothetical protein
MSHFLARMRARPQSKFTRLTDDEFVAGLDRLRLDAAAEPAAATRPVVERYDVAALSVA